MEIEPIWFDSMGAKSVSTRVIVGDSSILIDPGAAAMQPSYPLPDSQKIKYRNEARRKIQKKGENSNHIVISHYHYDHCLLPDFSIFDFKSLFDESELWIKDPNHWINYSQWERSREFIKSLCKEFEGEKFSETVIKPQKKKFEDPVPELKHAMDKDFGDYQERRKELLDKWSKRFSKWSEKWSKEDWIREPNLSVSVRFAEKERFVDGEMKVEFSKPLFHGIEYSKTGWVFATIIKDSSDYTFLHSSDLQGPTIEDQADWIIEKNPDYLILDGPATYLYGYLLNKTNLQRSVDNATRILKEANIKTFIYDHHLLRERKYRERTEKFWKAAENSETEVGTAAEILGNVPKIHEAGES